MKDFINKYKKQVFGYGAGFVMLGVVVGFIMTLVQSLQNYQLGIGFLAGVTYLPFSNLLIKKFGDKIK